MCEERGICQGWLDKIILSGSGFDTEGWQLDDAQSDAAAAAANEAAEADAADDIAPTPCAGGSGTPSNGLNGAGGDQFPSLEPKESLLEQFPADALTPSVLRKKVADFVEHIEAGDPEQRSHLPYCEDMGRRLEDTPGGGVLGEYSESEYAAIRKMDQLELATKNQSKPMALFALGPTGVGKTTALAAGDGESIPAKYGFKTIAGSKNFDAVILDGEFYRSVHAGFKELINEGLTHYPPCVWFSAWENGIAQRSSKQDKKTILHRSCRKPTEPHHSQHLLRRL
jgi:hypothetical protein